MFSLWHHSFWRNKLYALPLAGDTQIAIEMHMYEDTKWHFDHNKCNKLYTCYD